MKKLILIATLALSSYGLAQEFPDAPMPAGNAVVQDAPSGRFWDRQRIVSNSLAYGLAATDAVQTCYHLNRGYRERWNVFKGCGGISGSIAASQAGSTLIQYWFWKKGGNWNRFGKALPWFMAIDNGVAIGYTYTH